MGGNVLGNSLNKYQHILCLGWLRTKCSCEVHRELYMRGSRGDRGSGPPSPLKNHKNIGFLSNMGPDPRESYQACIQCGVIIGTLAKRRLNGVSLASRWWPAYIVVFGSSHQKQKTLPSLTPSGKTFWIRAWAIYNAPVICNHCFTPAPEQDRDIHSLVNVLCYYFYMVSSMGRKCWGLIDIDKHGRAV